MFNAVKSFLQPKYNMKKGDEIKCRQPSDGAVYCDLVTPNDDQDFVMGNVSKVVLDGIKVVDANRKNTYHKFEKDATCTSERVERANVYTCNTKIQSEKPWWKKVFGD